MVASCVARTPVSVTQSSTRTRDPAAWSGVSPPWVTRADHTRHVE